MKKVVLILMCSISVVSHLFASEQIIHLNIGYKTVHFAGKTRQAIAVNNQIPAPTLHFKEGENITLVVHNNLNEGTAIHWHGLLVPWQMDGVEGISQMEIPPGGVFCYRFTLKQSGTYWYHAHAGLQEQRGLYGGLIIEPATPPKYHYTKDFVVVLSDWSNTQPEQILANLKKEGDYYAPRFPLQPSLLKFIRDYKKSSKTERQELFADYKMMQQMRMSIYDLNDVAFDAFLLNGHTLENPWTAPVTKGDRVRLRFIGAAGNTIYRVKIHNTNMQMVHVEGNDVRPYTIKDFTIAPGETYDVLVKIQEDKPYLIYAESRDRVGAAYGALLTQPNQTVNFNAITAFPEPLPVTREMMDRMMGKMIQGSLPPNKPHNRSAHPTLLHKTPKVLLHQPAPHHPAKAQEMTMAHHGMMQHTMTMPIEPTHRGDILSAPDAGYRTSSETAYQPLRAAVKTNDIDKPIAGVINMELYGYMDRFIWFINGLPAYKTHPIPLEPGKRYRIIFTNNSMMFHPMHIHGHWFILRKGDNEYDPLLHTINVAPGATITTDIDTDASGQWFFHCHLLYHMMSGMSRILQYTTLIDIIQDKAKPQDIVKQTTYLNRPIVRVDEVMPIDVSMVKHPMGHPAGFWFAHFLDVAADPFHNVQRFTYKGLYGSDYNKLELLTNDAEINRGNIENADIDIFYWHLISQFWAIKGGVNYFNRPAQTPYWQAGLGIEGLMPWFIETDLRVYYYNGSAKLDIEFNRDTQITNNFFIRLDVRSILASKTIAQAEIGNGLNQMRYLIRPYYRFKPGLNAFIEYEHEEDYGIFKTMQNNSGDQATQNTLSIGLSALF